MTKPMSLGTRRFTGLRMDLGRQKAPVWMMGVKLLLGQELP